MISLQCHVGFCHTSNWSWNSSTLATSCEELTHWKRPWCWEGLGAGGEGDGRGWDGWMASPTRWTWVWVNSGSWWWTGRPGVLWFMGSLSRTWLSDWTELNWTWISHEYAYVYFLLNLTPHLTPLGCKQNTSLSSLSNTANSHLLSVLHMVMHIHSWYCLHLFHPLLLPHVHKSVLYIHGCSANRFIGTMFLNSIYMLY